MNKKAVAILTDVLILAFVFAAQHITSFMMTLPACFFLSRGIICPACGGTRCVNSFFSLDFPSAFGYNQFIFFMIIYLAVLVAVLNFEAFTNNRFFVRARKALIAPKTVIALAVLFALFGVLRNFYLQPIIFETVL